MEIFSLIILQLRIIITNQLIIELVLAKKHVEKAEYNSGNNNCVYCINWQASPKEISINFDIKENNNIWYYFWPLIK